LSLKGPFQGKVFLFPLRGNYLSPGQLNINEERRKRNGNIFCWEEDQRKRMKKVSSQLKKPSGHGYTNCMIINAMNVSPESFNFNISET
jgi:uncharacterized protein YllA (UPF0747 family)